MEPFLRIKEYGVWDLCKGAHVRVIGAMVLAIMDALEDIWIVDKKSTAGYDK
jgi:hypothetical protein